MKSDTPLKNGSIIDSFFVDFFVDIVDYPRDLPIFLTFFVDKSVEIVENKVGKTKFFRTGKEITPEKLEFKPDAGL